MLAVWIVLATLAIVMFLLISALVEMYRAIEQLRVETGVMDLLTQIDIPLGEELALRSGLPSEISSLDRSLVLVLSEMCSTCRQIAERLAGGLPPEVWVLFEQRDRDSGQQWLSLYGLQHDARVIRDEDGGIAERLGIAVSPAVIRFRGQAAVATHTVPSVRRLEEELRWLRDDGVNQPAYGRPPADLRPIK